MELTAFIPHELLAHWQNLNVALSKSRPCCALAGLPCSLYLEFGIEFTHYHTPQSASPAGGKEVQLDLPVFCISSRDAHKLEGRFRSEKGSIFSSLLHTEILQLRQHVHSLTGEHSPRLYSNLSRRLSVHRGPRPHASRQSSATFLGSVACRLRLILSPDCILSIKALAT